VLESCGKLSLNGHFFFFFLVLFDVVFLVRSVGFHQVNVLGVF